MNKEESAVFKVFVDGVFENDDLFILCFEQIQHNLDLIDDKKIQEMIELLSYWHEGEDFSKMDKLTILYRYKKMM